MFKFIFRVPIIQFPTQKNRQKRASPETRKLENNLFSLLLPSRRKTRKRISIGDVVSYQPYNRRFLNGFDDLSPNSTTQKSLKLSRTYHNETVTKSTIPYIQFEHESIDVQVENVSRSPTKGKNTTDTVVSLGSTQDVYGAGTRNTEIPLLNISEAYPSIKPDYYIPGDVSYEYEYEETYDYDYDPYDYQSDEALDDCDNVSPMAGNDPGAIIDGLPQNIKCSFLDQSSTSSRCLEQSLLELWKYCEKTIDNLRPEDILYTINNVIESPYFGFKYDYTQLLGGVKRSCSNCSNGIISATSAMYHFVTVVDLDNITSLGETADAGTDPDATLDLANYNWQEGAKDAILNQSEELKKLGISVTVRMTRSFTDETSKAIFFDLKRVIFCGLIMYLYTAIALGRLDFVEQRSYLTFVGIVSIMLSLEVCIGITAAIGYPYSPHHALLPFIMIGIGVDNMFVIVESWYNLDEFRNAQDLEKNMGETIKHAGVAITVTSLTDMFAFGVGCLTLLPGLEAFCLNCAIGILALYVLQLTWFLAWMVIDQKRIEARRNSVFPCFIHRLTVRPNENSEGRKHDKGQIHFKNIPERIMGAYSNLLEYKLYRIFILAITLAILVMGVCGAIQIKNKSDEVKHLPTDSYLRKWFDNLKEDYPNLGYNVKLFTGSIDPKEDIKKIDNLMNKLILLRSEGRIIKDIDSWWIAFNASLSSKFKDMEWEDIITDVRNPDKFSSLLSDFLHSSKGGKYTSSFHFNGTLECNKLAPPIVASSFDITYQKFNGREEHIPSVDNITDLIKRTNFSSEMFTNGRIYGSWEIDKVIAFELMRNLVLAIVCVFMITFILLSNFVAASLVLMCVLFSLIDVIGFLHFWGMTIDVLSCSNIVMSVGLCVDYSAHIAHAYLVSTGDFKISLLLV